MTNIKNIVLAVALALSVGYCTGYYTKGRFVKADQFEAATEARSETAKDIQQSLEISAVTGQEVAASNQQVAVIRKKVAARVQPKETPNEANLHLVCRDGLDVGTVRLLNSARDGSALDPASSADGASQAASGIGLPELLDNDLEVVGMYRDLAIKHNALVDYVESLIQKQADQ